VKRETEILKRYYFPPMSRKARIMAPGTFQGKMYSTITAAVASIPQPFTSDYEIKVDVPFDGYVETGLDVDAAAMAMAGYSLDITGVSSSENNVTYYFGDDLEYRVTGGSVTTIENVLAGENIARRVHGAAYVTGAEYEYLIKNHLGSTMFTTNETGEMKGSVYDYFPYGKQELVMNNPPAKITQTFTGKELDLYDGETVTGEDGEGRYYFGRRYYDADVGRWTSVDPAREFVDVYSYTGGNPILLVDKQGLDCKVSVINNSVFIEIPVTYGKNVDQPTRQKFEADVEATWTGKFGKYKVYTTVIEGKMNNIRLVETGDRSNVVKNKDLWLYKGEVDDKGTSAHEAGHFMKLPDQYQDVTDANGNVSSVPNPGYEKNIMGSLSGTPSENDITGIINANK
jgi:RHS repeat-associated protein